MLISIPSKFSSNNLFDKTKQPAEYLFKGMICFSGAHYLSFFRRTLNWLDYLIDDVR